MKRNTLVKLSGKKQRYTSSLTARTRTKKNAQAKLLGRHIVADPRICHGKPTFLGTRIMVSQVLEQVALGMDWESINERWDGSITKEAIAEAVRLSGQAFLEHAHEYLVEPTPA